MAEAVETLMLAQALPNVDEAPRELNACAAASAAVAFLVLVSLVAAAIFRALIVELAGAVF